jgi:hypothetical protein
MAAYELHIRNGPPEAKAKIRGPVISGFLALVTIGIYYFVWYYRINRELRDLGRARGYDLGQSPGTSLLASTLGALVIVPAIVSLVRTCKRIQGAQRVAGLQDVLNGWLAVVLYLATFIVPYPFVMSYMQSELNKVWAREGEPLAGAPPHPSMSPGGALPPAMPPPTPASSPPESVGGFAPPQPPSGPPGQP